MTEAMSGRHPTRGAVQQAAAAAASGAGRSGETDPAHASLMAAVETVVREVMIQERIPVLARIEVLEGIVQAFKTELLLRLNAGAAIPRPAEAVRIIKEPSMLTGPARAALYAAMCKFSFLILPETGAKQLMRNEALSVVPEGDAMVEGERYGAWELRKPIAVKKLVLMVSFFFFLFFFFFKKRHYFVRSGER